MAAEGIDQSIRCGCFIAADGHNAKPCQEHFSEKKEFAAPCSSICFLHLTIRFFSKCSDDETCLSKHAMGNMHYCPCMLCPVEPETSDITGLSISALCFGSKSVSANAPIQLLQQRESFPSNL